MTPETASPHTGLWIFLALAAFFGLIGVILLAVAIRLRFKHQQALSWPFVAGKITASSVGRHEESEGITFFCDLRYYYCVEGRPYEGRALTVSGGSGDEKGANEEHRRYPVGAAVTVYYNPRKHQDAILEHDPAMKGLRVLWIVGGSFVFASLVLSSVCVFIVRS